MTQEENGNPARLDLLSGQAKRSHLAAAVRVDYDRGLLAETAHGQRGLREATRSRPRGSGGAFRDWQGRHASDLARHVGLGGQAPGHQPGVLDGWNDVR
jgi:hypothetical protein